MLPIEQKRKYRSDLQHMLNLLDAGQDDGFEQELEAWLGAQQQALHQELGRMAREVHESLNRVRLDPRLQELAEKEVPQAQDRLHYVISLTQQAANRTLDLIESNVPRVEQLRHSADDLGKRWHRFCRRDLQLEEFRPLAQELGLFLNATVAEVDLMRADLSEILVAQGFQDLSGQMIKRVIGFMEELELGLLNLVRLSGPRHDGNSGQAPSEPAPTASAASTQVFGQDQVDALLSELGF